MRGHLTFHGTTLKSRNVAGIAIASIIRGGYGFRGASQPLELGIILLGLFLAEPSSRTGNFFTTPKTST
ncbi:MAG: hypothetical protein ABR589_08815 [Chthoniobacterales bacterium]